MINKCGHDKMRNFIQISFVQVHSKKLLCNPTASKEEWTVKVIQDDKWIRQF
jgi:hypothetical protein